MCQLKNCQNKNCLFVHNHMEQLYHPDNYKKKFCLSFINKKKCIYKNFCAFAHNEEEIKINLINKLPKD